MTDTTKKPMVFFIETINYSNVGGVQSSKDSLGRYRCMDCKDKPHTARCTTKPMENDKL